MYSISLLLCSIASLFSSTAWATAPCYPTYQPIASTLSGYGRAHTYCASNYPVPAATTTVIEPTQTSSVTIATSTILSTVGVATNTITAPPLIVSSTVASGFSTIIVSTETDTAIVTQTDTQTTFTTITTVVALQKRGEDEARLAIQSSCFNSVTSQPSSFVGGVCTCLDNAATVTVTSLPPIVTVSVTGTITQGVSGTALTTTTPTSTILVTAISTVPIVFTTTSTITTTTTTLITATATSTVPARGPSCQNPDASQGSGGCSSNCFCDSRTNTANSLGVCDTTGGCGTQCNSDLDCPDGQACATGGFFAGCPGGTSCVDYTQCTTTYNPNGSQKRFAGDFIQVVRSAERAHMRKRDGQTIQ